MILLWAMWISLIIIIWGLTFVAVWSIFETVELEFDSTFIGASAGGAVFILLVPFVLFFTLFFGYAWGIIGQ